MILLLKNRDGFVARNVHHDVMNKARKKLDKLTPEDRLRYRQASKVFYNEEQDTLSFESDPSNPTPLSKQVVQLEEDYYNAKDALKLATRQIELLKRFVLVADDVRAYGSADRMCEHTAGCCNACDADLAFDRARQELEPIL